MPPSPSPSYHWLDPSQLCHHKICKLALLLISPFPFLIWPVYLARMLMLQFVSTIGALVIIKGIWYLNHPFFSDSIKPISKKPLMLQPLHLRWYFWQTLCWQLVKVWMLISLDLSRFPTYVWQGRESWVSQKVVGGTINVVHPTYEIFWKVVVVVVVIWWLWGRC